MKKTDRSVIITVCLALLSVCTIERRTVLRKDNDYPQQWRVRDYSGLRMVLCYLVGGTLLVLRYWQESYLFVVRNIEAAVPFLPVPAIAVVGLCLISAAIAVSLNDTVNLRPTNQGGLFSNIDHYAFVAGVMTIFGMFLIAVGVMNPLMRGTPVSLLVTLSAMFFCLGFGLMVTNKR